MSLKSLTRFLLLSFVVLSVVVMVAQQFKNRSPAEAGGSPGQNVLPADALVVYYFHGDVRCPTCRTIEAYAQQAVEGKFVTELANGKLVWQVVNYELAENAHFVNEYKLVAPTVVLVRRAAGRQVDWRNLGRVWELVGDEAAFVDYVWRGVAEMLASNTAVAAH